MDELDQSYIVIGDCKERLLSHKDWPASDDFGLFHFTPVRTLQDPALLADCTFANVFINHKTDWGAPIPSTFEMFFEDMVRVLVPDGHKLVLNITDPYMGYFDPEDLTRRVLEPEKRSYIFLEKEIGERKYPSLFFECPLNQVGTLVDDAFSSSLIDIDGFVMPEVRLEVFEKSFKAGNTDVMFRQLIKELDLAFAVWGDHNGLFVVTDKFDISELRRLFHSSGLEKKIERSLQPQS